MQMFLTKLNPYSNLKNKKKNVESAKLNVKKNPKNNNL